MLSSRLGTPFLVFSLRILFSHSLISCYFTHFNSYRYPGERGGESIADVLFGDYHPSGRLPVTVYPSTYVNEILMTNMNMSATVEPSSPGRSYRFYTLTAKNKVQRISKDREVGGEKGSVPFEEEEKGAEERGNSPKSFL
jgi:hypothetical protein